MDYARLNDAVSVGVRKCLAGATPLETLNAYIIQLKDEGWNSHDLEHVRGACVAMLVGIHGRDIDPASAGE